METSDVAVVNTTPAVSLNTSGLTLMTNESLAEMMQTIYTYDRTTVWFTLFAGVPGNILIFITILSLHSSVSTFHYSLLAFFDFMALILQLLFRPLEWYHIVDVKASFVPIYVLAIYNIVYYTSIYANWVLVYVAVERLIAVRYPSQASIYLNQPRAKANAVLTIVLIYCFSAIVTIKMNLVGVAWTVVFTTFYTAFPLIIIIIIIFMLLNTFRENHKKMKGLLKLQNQHGHGDGHKGGIMPKSTSGLSRHSAPCGHTKYDQVYYLGESPKGGQTISKSMGELSKHGSPRKQDPMSTSVHSATYSPSFFSSARKINGSTQIPPVEEEPPEVVAQRAKERADREKCYTSMLLASATVFVLLTVPFTLIKFVYFTSERDKAQREPRTEENVTLELLEKVTESIVYFIHSLKFYIYFAASSYFRAHVLKLLTRRTLKPVDPPKVTIESDDPSKSFL